MANKAEAHLGKNQISNDINIGDMVLFSQSLSLCLEVLLTMLRSLVTH